MRAFKSHKGRDLGEESSEASRLSNGAPEAREFMNELQLKETTRRSHQTNHNTELYQLHRKCSLAIGGMASTAKLLVAGF